MTVTSRFMTVSQQAPECNLLCQTFLIEVTDRPLVGIGRRASIPAGLRSVGRECRPD